MGIVFVAVAEENRGQGADWLAGWGKGRESKLRASAIH
jgi:hypothetical protein